MTEVPCCSCGTAGVARLTQYTVADITLRFPATEEDEALFHGGSTTEQQAGVARPDIQHRYKTIRNLISGPCILCMQVLRA